MSSAIDYDFNKPKDIPIPAKMMNLHIPDRQSLYNCYMPFLEHGGLFITTNDKFSLSDPQSSCGLPWPTAKKKNSCAPTLPGLTPQHPPLCGPKA